MKCAFQNLPELKVKDSGFLSYPTNSQNQNVFTSNGSKKSTIFFRLDCESSIKSCSNIFFNVCFYSWTSEKPCVYFPIYDIFMELY